MDSQEQDQQFARILKMVEREYSRATALFGPFTSAHEGYAILLEEVDELWDAVKQKQTILNRNELMKTEAAMALRFLYDVIKWDEMFLGKGGKKIL